MATPMRSSDFKAVVEPILAEAFDAVYELRKDEWAPLFDVRPGTPREYHEEPVLYGFGAAPEIGDGAPVTYQSGGTLYTARYTYKQYGLAYALTQILVEDSKHINLGSIYSRYLANALVETKETLTANIINRAFTTGYNGGDGVPLISASHPIYNGTYSNLLTSSAALSMTSLEAMLVQIRNTAVDNSGKKMRLTPKRLVIHPNNMFNAEVILNSTLRTGAATYMSNEINPLKSMSVLPDGVTTISRLTSTTAWFIQTDSDRGLQLLTRRKLEKSMEGDFETNSMRYKATERYGLGWTDPRCLWGTPGT
jgi:hypothetical protein